MQSQQATAIQSQFQPLIILDGTDFDFSTLADGAPIRVSPRLIDDLSVGGNKRRKKERKVSFRGVAPISAKSPKLALSPLFTMAESI